VFLFFLTQCCVDVLRGLRAIPVLNTSGEVPGLVVRGWRPGGPHEAHRGSGIAMAHHRLRLSPSTEAAPGLTSPVAVYGSRAGSPVAVYGSRTGSPVAVYGSRTGSPVAVYGSRAGSPVAVYGSRAGSPVAVYGSRAGSPVAVYGSRTLALSLLVAGVVANHHHAAMATNRLALIADGLDAGLDLHRGHSFLL